MQTLQAAKKAASARTYIWTHICQSMTRATRGASCALSLSPLRDAENVQARSLLVELNGKGDPGRRRHERRSARGVFCFSGGLASGPTRRRSTLHLQASALRPRPQRRAGGGRSFSPLAATGLLPVFWPRALGGRRRGSVCRGIPCPGVFIALTPRRARRREGEPCGIDRRNQERTGEKGGLAGVTHRGAGLLVAEKSACG